MSTRVVVVAFVCGVMVAGGHAMAQATRPALSWQATPPTTSTPDAPAPVTPSPALDATPATSLPAAPAPATASPAHVTVPSPPPTVTTQPLTTTPPPATRPANRSAEETLRQMLQPQGEAARPLRPIEEAPPAVDATSGPGAVAPGATPRTVLREGTLLLDRVGRLTRGEDGRTLEFTLDADGRGMADAPLILLPNRKLMQLEGQVQSSYRDLKIRASGEVMEYRGRNYLLLQRWSVVPDVAQPLQ